ncbi:DUF3577 domain-containing protein [Pseudomonas caricapapayae]|uniref:DUF3577 domain-containing protein n=1 Tax=Pseudomonas caricapapayae TaxID=46678 RepID=UPI000F0063B9|nr:DUF3577 domain-containing protein [Pseudomonas caricapapayae]
MSHTSETKFFDLHTTGIGYLNRIREVKPKKGSAFLACTVAALHGAIANAEYSYIDCVVSGADAQRLIRRCQPAVDAKKKVLVHFRIGDIWCDAYLKDGEPRAQIKGRLLYIGWIKVDQQLVYQAPQSDGGHEPAQDLTQAGTHESSYDAMSSDHAEAHQANCAA